jgi:uncharacterized protein (DUF2141 family)
MAAQAKPRIFSACSRKRAGILAARPASCLHIHPIRRETATMTKRLICILGLAPVFGLALLMAATAQGGQASASLTLTIDNIRHDTGALMIAVHSQETGFDGAVGGKQVAVDGDSVVTVEFNGLAPGRYALRVFHDVNGNGALDTNVMGIPVEPFGFSNNVMGMMGPPSFDQAAFEIAPGGNDHVISLMHMN